MNHTKTEEVNLGLGVAERYAAHHHTGPMTYRDIAAFCGCDKEAIRAIERRALKKMRQRLIRHRQDFALHL